MLKRAVTVTGNDLGGALSGAIQDAFDFDDDHLHCFTYPDRFGLSVSVNLHGRAAAQR